MEPGGIDAPDGSGPRRDVAAEVSVLSQKFARIRPRLRPRCDGEFLTQDTSVGAAP
jgi:hypothetical protein